MSEINDNQCEAIDPLRLDRCPDCGYLLTGLPEHGICPECGFAYRADMIVLYGWAGKGRGDESTRRPTLSYWLGAVVASVLILLLFNIFGALLLVVYWGWMIHRRRRYLHDAPAPVQLRLFAEGFGQRNGIGPVELHPWRSDKRQLRFERVAPHQWRIRSWRFWMWRPEIIDFEFQSHQRCIERIKVRVEEWRRQVEP
jgi:hypothetical protein